MKMNTYSKYHLVPKHKIERYKVYRLIHYYTGNNASPRDNYSLVVVKAISFLSTSTKVLLQKVDKTPFTLRRGKVKYLTLRFRHKVYGNKWGLIYTDPESILDTSDKTLFGPVLKTINLEDIRENIPYILREFNHQKGNLYGRSTLVEVVNRNIMMSKFNIPPPTRNTNLLYMLHTIASDCNWPAPPDWIMVYTYDLGLDYYLRYPL